MMVHACNPSAGDRGVSGVCWPVSLPESGSSRFHERCCFKSKVELNVVAPAFNPRTPGAEAGESVLV